MKKQFGLILGILAAVLSWAQPIKVEIRINEAGKFTLLRNGAPYYINGVGGDAYMETTKECKANSIRLWGPEKAQEVLDLAQKNGLTVMLGLWMAPERHGFDYSDPIACQDQLEQFKSVVNRFKNHPALLLWGVGNEMDLEYTDFSVWKAVQNIAEMIHLEDPNHPTCVVTAGIDPAEVHLIKTHCPAIDMLGVNTYGDLPGLADKIRQFGWTKPYLVTEWGPNGHWEVQKTSWNSPIEQTSTQKQETYRERYLTNILADTGLCLGSYAFLWGEKQETTPTWYGTFVGENKTGAVHELKQLWSGTPFNDPCPKITNYRFKGKLPSESVKLKKGEKIEVALQLENEPDAIGNITWELMPESTFTGVGGDAEQKPEAIQTSLKKTGAGQYSFRAPYAKGPYRLFVYVKNGKGSIATANFPFLVE
ncbi:MAG: hypothetical protein L6Q78_01930 [Bacteroidia bacterium]|nr:hypothetical protein [Bacteroidia bacterium]